MIENPEQPNFSDNNVLKNKESSLATPGSITEKMSQPVTNSADTENGNLDPDSTLAFFVGTICVVAGTFSILVSIDYSNPFKKKLCLIECFEPS